ncbi:MAG: hypothetical protein APF77_08340 [Clostridia bacterium BRH_c25]|nr:MAG: hypothetical protein APF77_08340 [Clostridia bacterium BRH_c25]
MKAQLTITVNTGKWLIAKAIVSMAEVQEALKNGKVILKGGTTVSCIAEELLGIKLRICGRVTKRGTVAGNNYEGAPSNVLIEDGKWQSIDDCFIEKSLQLGPKDVAITGANAIDAEGNAAIMAGSPGGNAPGMSITTWATEGAKVLVAAGLEKLIPGKISKAVIQASRKDCEFAMGMAFGLIPVYGDVITEMEALGIIADVTANVIGRGGIDGAEGSTVVLVEGDENEVRKVIHEVFAASRKPISGYEESLIECKPGSKGCAEHLACFHSRRNRLKVDRSFY